MGLHDARIFGFAFWDIVLTIIAAIIASHYSRQPFTKIALGLFITGEVLHWTFGVQTAFTRMIGLN